MLRISAGSMRTRALGCGTAALALLSLVALSVACEKRSPLRIRPGPVIKQQVFASPQPFLEKVAVIPFYPIEISAVTDASGVTPPGPGASSADLIGSFVSDALVARGVTTIGPSDVALAFEAAGVVVPRGDARFVARRAQQDFGATSVLLGRVIRYREREGSAAGATYPASVAFEVSLHEAPSGRRLWNGRFDETQQALSQNVFRAREYPGGGTRWLTAAEFARWGADRMVAALLAVPAPQAPPQTPQPQTPQR